MAGRRRALRVFCSFWSTAAKRMVWLESASATKGKGERKGEEGNGLRVSQCPHVGGKAEIALEEQPTPARAWRVERTLLAPPCLRA